MSAYNVYHPVYVRWELIYVCVTGVWECPPADRWLCKGRKEECVWRNVTEFLFSV